MTPLAPPTLSPVEPPPVVRPLAGPPAGKAHGELSRGRGDADGERGGRHGRDREGRASAAAHGGMHVGPKVMLACGVTALVAILVVVFPSLSGGGAGAAPDESFHSAGVATVRALASAVGGGSAGRAEPASTRSGGGKAVDRLAADVESRLKYLRVSGDDLSNLVDEMAVLKALALGSVDAARKLDGVIDTLTRRIKEFKGDAEDRQKLIEQKNSLIEVQKELQGAPGSVPVAAGAPDLGQLAGAHSGWGAFQVRAVWITNAKRDKLLAQSDPGAGLPQPAGETPAGGLRDTGWYEATVRDVPVTVFYAPLVNMAGRAFVAMDTPASKGPGPAAGSLGLLMLVLGPILVGLVGLAVANAHNKPLKDLAKELDRLGASGDPARRIPARGAEAGAIAHSVERMVSNLKFRDQHEMSDLKDVVAEQQGTAAQIHHGLMPRNPPRLSGYEVETLFKPGFEIGGDHFDYFRIDDAHLGVIILDTSVRGIPAAIVMSMARAYVRAEAPGSLSPAEVLMKVNRLLAADLSQGQYVTALYAVIDTANGAAKVASAGHLPMIVYRHAIGKTAIVNPEGIALGLDVGPVFDRTITDVDVPIGVGDRIVLHTDGALKVQNEVGEEYGEQRLYAAVKQEAPKNSQAFVNFVGAAIDAFHVNTPQNDDITISTVKRLR